MSDIAMHVDNLSKRYRIGLKEEMHDTLGGAIAAFVTRPARNLRRLRKLSRFSENSHEPEDIIWALKDVSFEVEQGEVVGIIGRNGAGKSTLLKILSRITEPTVGRVTTRGRVSSLLEVGTGFHPELTGRDNVYLNGTILGMRRKEVARMFDEIVDFSGVEKFLDTPVKRYSSGMKVRLAFSVAAHLEPEILLVDEVLAVGDVEFQKRCLGRMGEVAKEGRTVLFVSHNMGTLANLCTRGIYLAGGEIKADGDITSVIGDYLAHVGDGQGPVARFQKRTSDQRYWVEAIWVADPTSGDKLPNIRTGQSVDLNVRIESSTQERVHGVCNVGFYTLEGKKAFELTSLALGGTIKLGSNTTVRYRIPRFPLLGGDYVIGVFLAEGRPGHYVVLDHVREALKLRIVGGDYHGHGQILDVRGAGLFTLPFEVISSATSDEN